MALAIQRMIEENLYWAMVNDRWNTAENWPILKSTVLGGLPKLPRELLAPIARRGVIKQLVGHGMGIHYLQRRLCQPDESGDCGTRQPGQFYRTICGALLSENMHKVGQDRTAKTQAYCGFSMHSAVLGCSAARFSRSLLC